MHSMSSIMFAISEKKVFISLPDLRGHLRYCHQLASIVVGLPIRKLLHFNLLLWYHWANWNHTWKECLLDASLESLSVLLYDQKCTKETRSPKKSKVCVHIYRYKLLIVHFYDDFCKKIPFRSIHNVIM